MIRTLFAALTLCAIALPASAQDVNWSTNASAHAKEMGKQFTYTCPANGVPNRSVYGTDTYTTDSSICAAAVHAGKITPAAGGKVTIEIKAGMATYAKAVRNGVASKSWGGYHATYVFVASDGPTKATWRTNATSIKASLGQTFGFACPPGGAFGSVYGTETYTTDSSICTAAVHAGKITKKLGGTVKIFLQPGVAQYVGSTKNGVTTRKWGAYHTHYIFK